MPEEVDKQVDAIVQSCMEKGGKDKEECTSMAWAIVNSRKDDKKEDKKEDNG